MAPKTEGALLSAGFQRGTKLGPPAIGALSHPLFWLGDSVPLLRSTTEESWYPYSNLSTGGPSRNHPISVVWGLQRLK